MNRFTQTVTVALASAGLAAAMAYPASASPPVNWQARTCAAFSTWERHQTSANLATLGADSFHVSWRGTGSKYGLGSDVWGLVSDVRSGAAGKYVTADRTYIGKDCG